ncbi:hypothetical protein BJ912DRAFT_1054537 [Pholiota molesta]|nr:hypothetical protein BJ912DRAFT_1054537 [Pholiota molesta]
MLSLQRLRSGLYRPFRQLYRRPAPALNPWRPIESAHTLGVPTLPLGTRMLATSKVENRKQRPGCPQGPHIASTFELRTLRSERLSAVGQEIIDLSGKAWPCAPTLINGHEPRCAYEYVRGARGHYVLTPYPEGTRGFFYFHSPADGPELCAGVHFRICESAAEFARGRDLLGVRGNVWGPKVLELVKYKVNKGFLALCRAEQLVDEALIDDLDRLDGLWNMKQYQYLLSDPFDLNLAKSKQKIMYVTRTKAVRLVFPQQVFCSTPNFFPLTGSVKAQFELSSLPEHKALGPTLVIRVLDIIDPIAEDPRYDGVPPVPVPGTLLQRMFRGRLCALAIPLKLQPMAEDLLALAKTTWAYGYAPRSLWAAAFARRDWSSELDPSYCDAIPGDSRMGREDKPADIEDLHERLAEDDALLPVAK